MLGDGPVYIALYKVHSVQIVKDNQEIDLAQLMLDCGHTVKCAKDEETGKLEYWVDPDEFIKWDSPCDLKFENYKIEIRWIEKRRNNFLYVQLEQPNGDVWHGWTGMCVGAGFDEPQELEDTKRCEKELCKLWPNYFKK